MFLQLWPAKIAKHAPPASLFSALWVLELKDPLNTHLVDKPTLGHAGCELRPRDVSFLQASYGASRKASPYP